MNAELQAKIRDTSSLPTLPAAALRVLQLTQKDNLALDDLAKTISSDPALSGKVLRAVNSSFYGLPQKVVSVNQAVALLGIHSVRTLVLGFTLATAVGAGKGTGGFNRLAYWRRSMYAATAARVIGQRVLENRVEECFVAALLMDLGTLLFDQIMGDQYGEIWERAHSHADLLILETHRLGMTHAEAGALLAEHWKLPDSLRIPIASHHGPAGVEDFVMRKITEVVSLAGRVADVFVTEGNCAAESISTVREQFRTLYQIGEIQADAILTQIGQKTGELAPLFEVRLNNAAGYDAILEKASQRLLELSIAGQEPGPSNKRRAERVRRDGKIIVTPCCSGILGKPVQVRLKDLSATGIGLIHTDRLEIGSQFLVQLPQGNGQVKHLLYTVMRCDTSGGLSSLGAELAAVLRPESVGQGRINAA